MGWYHLDRCTLTEYSLQQWLGSVAAVSTTDVWAVGSGDAGTLTEQWNGSVWQVVTSPNLHHLRLYNSLNSVAVVSANDVWAVGFAFGYGPYRSKTLTEHWNGTAWAIVPSPNLPRLKEAIGATILQLAALAVVSTNNVWAVGSESTGDAFFSPLIENWNGTKWKVVYSPSQENYNGLSGVTFVPGTDHLWAVGYDAISQDYAHTFTEYYG